MLLTDKLLKTITRMKSPSIQSIYNQGLDKDPNEENTSLVGHSVFLLQIYIW